MYCRKQVPPPPQAMQAREEQVHPRRNAPRAARAPRVEHESEEEREAPIQWCVRHADVAVEGIWGMFPSCQSGWYECKQCDKVYSYKADLTQYQKDHVQAVISCEKCGTYSAKSEKNLVKHMCHCGVTGLYTCDTCGESFDSRKVRWYHKQCHKKKWICTLHLCVRCSFACPARTGFPFYQ